MFGFVKERTLRQKLELMLLDYEHAQVESEQRLTDERAKLAAIKAHIQRIKVQLHPQPISAYVDTATQVRQVEAAPTLRRIGRSKTAP